MHEVHDWPIPPLWPEHLRLIRQLPDDDEWAALSRRLVHLLPDGPWVGWDAVLPTLRSI